ncbi:hypothetical protein HYW60_00820 [Candidatus Kaiserbacteria bacterium]|nr:hypothetical protein [Candidatus Kaiserbacteria bacterium]
MSTHDGNWPFDSEWALFKARLTFASEPVEGRKLQFGDVIHTVTLQIDEVFYHGTHERVETTVYLSIAPTPVEVQHVGEFIDELRQHGWR